MKVLIVMDNLSCDSGVSSIVMSLYRNIKNVHFDFLIFKDNENSYIEEIRKNGSKVYVLSSLLSPKTVIKANKQTKAFFKEHSGEYDAVHLHSPTINEFTLKYAKMYGWKHRIIHSHSSMTSVNPIKSKVNAFLLRNAVKYANHHWSCSNKASEFLYGKDFVENNKIEVIKNAVDPSKYSFDSSKREMMRAKLSLEGKRVFIHVSNFSPIKNLSFLLPAIEQTVKCVKETRFLFVGDGPVKIELEQAVKEKGLSDYCLFVGRQTDVKSYLNVADALLLPSIKEGLPLTVIEAQANGLPCLVSDTVTRECDTGNARFFELNEQVWTDELLSFKSLNDEQRTSAANEFIHSDFNIENEALRIEKLYMNMENLL